MFDPGGSNGIQSLHDVEHRFSTDQHQVRGLRREEMHLDGRRVIVERARVSGGISGMHEQRMMLVRIQVAPRDWAVLRGWVHDDAGYDELLAISRSMRLVSAGREPIT